MANVGICVIAPWDEVTDEVWNETLSVNLTGTWNTGRVTPPHLIRGGGGSIIMTSSVAGLKGLPFLAPYVASKHGITGLTRTLAHELARHHIRVNSLHPGGVDTPMGDEAALAPFGPALEANPLLAGTLQTLTPNPISQPEDQANAVLFLASDESRFVTACALTVDAGATQY